MVTEMLLGKVEDKFSFREKVFTHQLGEERIVHYPLIDHHSYWKVYKQKMYFLASHAYWNPRSQEQLDRLNQIVAEKQATMRIIVRDMTWFNAGKARQVFIFGFDDKDVIEAILSLPYSYFDSRCSPPEDIQ